MKVKQICFSLFFLILWQGSSLFAQSNVIKIGPLKLIQRSVALSFEHALNEDMSFGIGTNVFLRRDLFGNNEIINSSSNLTLKSIPFSGFTITPEFRYYIGEAAAPKGFYLNPFLRYLQYNSSLEADILSNGELSTVATNLRFRGAGIGFSIGYQWLINDQISIDWHGGLGFALSGLKHTGTDFNGPIENDLEEYVDIIEEWINEQVLLDNQTILIDDISQLDFRVPGIVWPVFRTQISIGYAF